MLSRHFNLGETSIRGHAMTLVKVLVICSLVTIASSCGSLRVDPEDSAGIQSAKPPLLNSERIRQEFGSYGVEVLEEENDVRVSSLYSIEQESKVTRTIAVVNYPSQIPEQLLPAHLEIKNGGSIGEVFSREGWSISKRNLYFGEWQGSADLSGVYTLMGGIKPTALAVHMYEFVVSRAGEQFGYATITEIHHPDYLNETELETIYGPEVEDSGGKDRVISILKTARAAVLNAVPRLQEAALQLLPARCWSGNVLTTRFLWA